MRHYRFTPLLPLFMLALGALAGPACGKPHPEAEGDDGYPTGSVNGREFDPERNFSVLINEYAQAKVEPTPWPGPWWPYAKNGIAAGKSSGWFGNSQSPAGKYDEARGRRFKAEAWEIANHSGRVPGVQGWWGHCNGWSAAASLFPEPRVPVKVNGVSFSPGDIKAILTEGSMEASSDFYGSRVEVAGDRGSPQYNDVVPAQFFLVLTNYIGKLQHAVIIDRYTGDQVWNQPVAGYRFDPPVRADYLGADPSAPHVHRINVTGTLWWVKDDVAPETVGLPFQYADSATIESRKFKMELWLDGPVVFDHDGKKVLTAGNVIVTREGEGFAGGAWRMGDAGGYNNLWPDYMWVPHHPEAATDYANPQIDIGWVRTNLVR